MEFSFSRVSRLLSPWEKANTILIATWCLTALLLPRVIVHAPNVTLGKEVQLCPDNQWIISIVMTSNEWINRPLSPRLFSLPNWRWNENLILGNPWRSHKWCFSFNASCQWCAIFCKNKCFNKCNVSSQSTIYLFINCFIVTFIDLRRPLY